MDRNWNNKDVFIDTSAIIASIGKKEDKHEEASQAIKALKQQGYHFFISNYIVDEVYAGILNASKIPDPSQRIRIAFQVLDWLHDEEEFSVLFIEKPFEERARKRLLNFTDKLWSITDMTSFLLMEEGKINYFLSFDNDFNQASCHFEFVDVIPYIM